MPPEEASSDDNISRETLGTTREVRLDQATTEKITEIDAEIDIQTRLRKGLKDEKTALLWTGEYEQTEFEKQEKAECSLIAYLGWRMNGDSDIVRSLMDIACENYPRTDSNEPRKWSQEDEEYQEEILRYVVHQQYYNPDVAGQNPDMAPSEQSPYEGRSEVSEAAKETVYDLLSKEGATTSAELNRRVDFSYSTLNRALNELEKEDRVDWYRDESRKDNPNVYLVDDIDPRQ